MATAKKSKPAAKTATAAKATKQAAKATADKGMQRFNEAAELANELSSETLATMNEVVANSVSTLREIGERNYGLMSRTFEQGMETREALTNAKDVREAVEVQSGFAKSVFSAYAQEMNAQAGIYTGMWRDAMKPFQKHLTDSFEKFQSAR